MSPRLRAISCGVRATAAAVCSSWNTDRPPRCALARRPENSSPPSGWMSSGTNACEVDARQAASPTTSPVSGGTSGGPGMGGLLVVSGPAQASGSPAVGRVARSCRSISRCSSADGAGPVSLTSSHTA